MSPENNIEFISQQLDNTLDKLISAKLALNDIPEGYKKDFKDKCTDRIYHIQKLINTFSEFIQ